MLGGSLTTRASAAAPKALSAQSAGWAALSSRRPPLRPPPALPAGHPGRTGAPFFPLHGLPSPGPSSHVRPGHLWPGAPPRPHAHRGGRRESPRSRSGRDSPFRPHPAAGCRSLRPPSRQGLAARPPRALPGDRLRSLPAGAFRSARRGRRDPRLFPPASSSVRRASASPIRRPAGGVKPSGRPIRRPPFPPTSCGPPAPPSGLSDRPIAAGHLPPSGGPTARASAAVRVWQITRQ